MEMRMLMITLLLLVTGHAAVTVEEGDLAGIPCEGFLPHGRSDAAARFAWYKEERKAQQDEHSKVAVYDKATDTLTLSGGLAGRATVDATKGTLIINTTRISDHHPYTCFFSNFVSGPDFTKEMSLQITVTPTVNDLKFNSPGSVPVDSTISLKCDVARVRPVPRDMNIEFINQAGSLEGKTFSNKMNRDNETYSASVEFTLRVTEAMEDKELVCVYLSQDGHEVRSEPVPLTFAQDDSTGKIVAGVLVPIIVLVLLGAACFAYYNRDKRRRRYLSVDLANPNDGPVGVGAVGAGFAWKYFYSYLNVIDIKNRIENSDFYKTHSANMLRQFVVVLPGQYSEQDLRDTASKFKGRNNLDAGLKQERAGRERTYDNFVHTVKCKEQSGVEKEYYFCGDCPRILSTLRKMLKDETIKVDTDVVKRQIRLFKSELEDLVKLYNMDVVIIEYSKQQPENLAGEIKTCLTIPPPALEPGLSGSIDPKESTLEEITNGMAWDYYYTYLILYVKKLKPIIKKCKDEFGAKVSDKLFILIPSSAECPVLANKYQDITLERSHKIEIVFAGNPITYETAFYNIKNERYAFVEYCTPLQTIQDLPIKNKTEMCRLLNEVLESITNKHLVMTRATVEYLYIDDKATKQLADLLLEKVKALG